MVGVIVRDEKRVDFRQRNAQLGEPYRRASSRIEQQLLIADFDQSGWPKPLWIGRWRSCTQ